MKKFFYILILLPLLFAFEAFSADYALIYDEGGKFDKSFNEAAYDGAEKFKAETGEDYLEFEDMQPPR